MTDYATSRDEDQVITSCSWPDHYHARMATRLEDIRNVLLLWLGHTSLTGEGRNSVHEFDFDEHCAEGRVDQVQVHYPHHEAIRLFSPMASLGADGLDQIKLIFNFRLHGFTRKRGSSASSPIMFFSASQVASDQFLP